MFENPEQAFGGTKPMLDLIETIYATVGAAPEEAPRLWSQVLDRISAASRGRQIFLFTDGIGSGMPNALAGERTDPRALRQFVEHYASVNVLAEPCDAMFRDGDVRYSHWAVANNEFERSEFYADFFDRFDMYYSFGIKIPVVEQAQAYLSCQRPKREPAFDEQDGVVLQTLTPHLRRAFALHHQLGAMQSFKLGLETALEAHDHAVLGLDARGRVVLCNPKAHSMVQAGTGVRLVQGKLSCPLTENNRALQTMLAGVLAGGAGGAMLIHRTDKAALRVTVSAFRAVLPVHSETLAVLVFLSDPSELMPSRAETMRALYGLTPTEGRVADALLEGLEIREVAGRMRITVETARFHVKRVLAKTSARRQSELIRLMLTLPGNSNHS